MFFTRIGRVAAWLALVLGVLMAVGAVMLFEQFEAGSAKQAFYGRMIDRGIALALIGIVLGVLTEIRPPEKS